MPDAPNPQAPTSSALFELRDVTAPYPGLRPFEAWEAEVFFGREAHTKRLLEILRDQAFLAVIGPSGSGKSSLVRAGLIPQLPRGRLGTGSRWRVATMRPGNEPVRSLARALLQRDVLGPSLLSADQVPQSRDDQTLGVAVLEAELRRGPLGLVQVAQMAARREAASAAGVAAPDDDTFVPPDFNLLVLVDQFEELFTYLDAAGAAHREALAREADAFVNLLLAAREHRAARVFVVLTMRTDFLGQCVRFLALPDAINRAQYLTPRLSWTEILDAIVKPARHFGGDVDAALANELINEVGTDPDQLPLLQHALSRMWESAKRRTGSDEPTILRDDFIAVGGVRGALSQHAELALAKLDDADVVGDVLSAPQRAAQRLFLAITEQRLAEGGGQTVRRPQSLDRIVQWSGVEASLLATVAMHFADDAFNFIGWDSRETLPGDPVDRAAAAVRAPDGATVIDISHEALIRQWERLRGWVQEEARRAADYRRLRDKALEYAGAGRAGAGLLVGAGLARAVEWLNDEGRVDARGDDWRPTLAWATRYAVDESQALAEFDAVCEYIRGSARAAFEASRREREQEENLRLAEEARRDAIAKAQLAEKESERAAAESSRATAESLRAKAEAERASAMGELLQSQALAARRQRFMIGGLAVMLALACMLAYWTWTLRNAAEAQTRVEQARTLWSPISFEDGRLSEAAQEGLLLVARAPNNVTQAFLRLMHDEDALARHFVRAPDQLLAATVGSSPRARDDYLRMLGAPGPGVSASRGGAPAPVRALAGAAARLALSAPVDDDDALVNPFVAALGDQLRANDSDTGDAWRLPADMVLALGPQMPASRRAALMEAVVARATGSHEQALPWLVAGAVGCQSIGKAKAETSAKLMTSLLSAVAANRKTDKRGASARFRIGELALEDEGSLSAALPFAPLPRILPLAVGRLADCVDEASAVTALRAALPSSETINAIDIGLLRALVDRQRRFAPDVILEAVLSAVAKTKPDSSGQGSDSPARETVVSIYRVLETLIGRVTVEQNLPVIRVLETYATRPDKTGAQLLAVALLDSIARQADGASREYLRAVAKRLPAGKTGQEARLGELEVGAGFMERVRAGILKPSYGKQADAESPPPAQPQPDAASVRAKSAWTVEKLLSAIEADVVASNLQVLGAALGTKAAGLPSSDRLALAQSALTQRVRSEDMDQQAALDAVLQGIADKSGPGDRSALRALYAEVIRNADSTLDLDEPVRQYLKLAAKTSAQDADTVAAELKAGAHRLAIQSLDDGEAFDAVLQALPPAQRRQVAMAVVDAAWPKHSDGALPGNSKRRSAGANEAPSIGANALTALHSLGADARPMLAERLLDNLVAGGSAASTEATEQSLMAMLKPEPAGSSAAQAASRPVATAGAEDWRRVAGMASDRLPRATHAYAVRALGRVIRGGMAEQARGDAASADMLFSLLKYPAAEPAKTAEAIRKLFKADGAPTADEGWWALMAWAQRRFPDLRLDEPAR